MDGKMDKGKQVKKKGAGKDRLWKGQGKQREGQQDGRQVDELAGEKKRWKKGYEN